MLENVVLCQLNDDVQGRYARMVAAYWLTRMTFDCLSF